MLFKTYFIRVGNVLKHILKHTKKKCFKTKNKKRKSYIFLKNNFFYLIQILCSFNLIPTLLFRYKMGRTKEAIWSKFTPLSGTGGTDKAKCSRCEYQCRTSHEI